MRAPAPGLGWRRFIPISVWLTSYERGFLLPDVIAALTVWALMVPEAMAYASIAGMPPETGLYAALVAPLAYAIFGTSRQLNVGPSSTVAVLSFSIVGGLAVGNDPATFYSLTAALAILTGAFFVIAGLARLGFLADFMSRPVLDGFIVGLALMPETIKYMMDGVIMAQVEQRQWEIGYWSVVYLVALNQNHTVPDYHETGAALYTKADLQKLLQVGK